MLGHIGHLDRVAQVGLVGAVPKRRVTVGDLRPVLVNAVSAAEFLEHALDHRLHGVEDILLRDEGHLHVELVEIRRAAVGARILVPETRRDLEIAVETRNHDQLLEELRRLRQGIEPARMQARRHEEIARAPRGWRR